MIIIIIKEAKINEKMESGSEGERSVTADNNNHALGIAVLLRPSELSCTSAAPHGTALQHDFVKANTNHELSHNTV